MSDVATGAGARPGTNGDCPGSPSLTGYAREFSAIYTNSSGERFDVPFGVDTESQNFFYDAWVNLANPSTGIANVEMDMNQVMPNGQTVIYGFQCDGYSGTWDYTVNTGTPSNPVDTWRHSLRRVQSAGVVDQRVAPYSDQLLARRQRERVLQVGVAR